MASDKQLPSGALAVLLLTVFVDVVGFGIIIPFLPFWAERFGATPALVTLLLSSYAALQFVFAVVWGWLSDRWGRKPVLLISLAGSVLSFLWLGLADALWMLFGARALAGAMGGSISVAQAYVADVTTHHERARGMGLLGAAFGLGFILGPAIGGLLAGGDPNDPDFQTPFFVGAAVTFLALILGVVCLREPARHAEPAVPGDLPARLRAFASVLRRPGVALPIAIATAGVFVMGGVEATFALWTERQFAWGPRENGYVFAYAGLLLVATQAGLVGRLVRRFGETRLVVAGTLAMVLGIGALPLADSVAMVVLGTSLLAVGIGLGNPALNSLTSRNAPAYRQGVVLGASQSSQSLARIIGPVFAGVLFAAFGRHMPYIAGAAIMILALTLTFRLARNCGLRTQ